MRLELEFLTPGFVGGSDQEAEWRAASVRGQLRWWFRAVAGGVLAGNLDEVRRFEAEVFGSIARRSALQLRTDGQFGFWPSGFRPEVGDQFDEKQLAEAWGVPPTHPDHNATVARLKLVGREGRTVPTRTLGYLGYGCIDRGNVVRSVIAPGSVVGLRIRGGSQGPLRLSKRAAQITARALWAWLHLGGIGARSRNGFGSLRCIAVEDDSCFLGEARLADAPSSADQFLARAAELLRPGHEQGGKGTPAWTHFSKGSKIVIGTERFATWDRALARAGAWLIAFRRRYGYPGDSRTKPHNPLSGRDYVWASPAARPPHRRRGFPDRAGFGLPLPFGKVGETVIWTAGTNGRTGDARRASPLLIHIAKLTEGFVPVFTHLPARFLPVGGQLQFKDHPRPVAPVGREQETIIDCFLDDLATKKLVQEAVP